MQETIKEILDFCQQHSNERTISQMRKKGVSEAVVLGVAQKDLKTLYKKHKNNHELALALYEQDHLDVRSLACMICDLDKMTQEQFDEWMNKTESTWLIDYQLSVTLAGHDHGQDIAESWINSNEPKRVRGGYYTYSWMLANKEDDQFNHDKIKELLYKVSESEIVTDAMAYYVKTVGVSYQSLYKEALQVAQTLKNQSAINGILRMKENGKLGFKRSYLRC